MATEKIIHVHEYAPIRVEVNLNGLGDLLQALFISNQKSDKVLEFLHLINTKIENMGQELDDLTAAVEKDTTVDQSAITLLQGLKAKLDAAGTDPTALKALSTQLGNNAQQLADAISANTPSEMA